MEEFFLNEESSSSSSSSSDGSSSGSEFDEMLAEVSLDRDVPKNEDYFETVVENYDDQDFFAHFRVSRQVAHDMSTRYGESVHYHSTQGKYGNVTPVKQVCIFLWFAGHQGAGFAEVADRFNVTVSTTFRIIQRVTGFLNDLAPEVIKWPDEAEKRYVERRFADMGFPNVIGAVDGTHIRIDRPKTDPDAYYNRKKYHSVQLQVTCDDRKRFTSIYCGFPGSVHDARVFRRSPLSRRLREKCGDYVLLGDTAYPCSRNLVTPFKNTGRLSRRHHRFNARLSRSRVIVEHSIGLLKNKFRQLYHVKCRRVQFIVFFIRACCVLHNLAVDDAFPQEMNVSIEAPDQPGDDDQNDDEMDETPDRADGVAYRNNLLDSLFPI